MRKVILINGLIAGLIVSGMMIITQPLLRDGTINYDNGMIVGYASMVIALSMIFFGIKTYRDQYENGSVSFWQAFKVGILIAMVASIMYALTWEVYYRVAAPDFMTHYTEYSLEKMKKDGATQAELSTARTELEEWGVLYQNPFIRFLMTLMEIVPVGIVISLIAAAILKEKRILPAT